MLLGISHKILSPHTAKYAIYEVLNVKWIMIYYELHVKS